MRRILLTLCISTMLCGPASAQKNISPDPSSFCANEAKKSAKFNDSQGFSNVAMRQGERIKVYREIASPDLDWAVYDGYTFSSKEGTRLTFSRVVIYAGNSIVYTQIVNEDGKLIDNKSVLPEGFYVPSEPSLAKLSDFCKLSVK